MFYTSTIIDWHLLHLHAVVSIGFNQSEVLVTEGTVEEAIVCTEVTSGTLERNITILLETSASMTLGTLNEFTRHIQGQLASIIVI